jgi:cohesin complex subunit SCC1
VWLAAHWNKKLTRAMIAKSDVVEACDSIIKPAAPLALRTSGHLLLGVVRIHDSKQKNLMNDCSEALIKIKVCVCCLNPLWRNSSTSPSSWMLLWRDTLRPM